MHIQLSLQELHDKPTSVVLVLIKQKTPQGTFVSVCIAKLGLPVMGDDALVKMHVHGSTLGSVLDFDDEILIILEQSR